MADILLNGVASKHKSCNGWRRLTNLRAFGYFSKGMLDTTRCCIRMSDEVMSTWHDYLTSKEHNKTPRYIATGKKEGRETKCLGFYICFGVVSHMTYVQDPLPSI
jgi:hypothetical protein